jgi:hypothetical protein
MKKLKTRNEWVSGECRFYGDEIKATSYRHWTFLTVVEGKIIFNDYNFSVTTRKHQRMVRELLDSLGYKIDIFVNMKESLSEHSLKMSSLYPEYSKYIQLLISSTNPRLRETIRQSISIELVQIKTRIKVLRDLGATIKVSDIADLYRYHKTRENIRRSAIKEFKVIKNKIISINGMTGAFKVTKNDVKSRVFKVIDDEGFTRHIDWICAVNNVKICPLRSALTY